MPSNSPTKRLASPLTFDDLVADLVWPKLLRAGSLATRPARLGLALVYLMGVVLFYSLAASVEGFGDVTGFAANKLGAFGKSLNSGEFKDIGSKLYDLTVVAPAYALKHRPIVSVVFFGVFVVWTALFGGAISRTCATEFASGVTTSWPQALAFAVSRWKSLVFALLIPLLIIWTIALGLAAAGWLLFSFKGLNVVGGLLYILFILAGFVASIITIAFALGHQMLVPSVTCEGTDAIDAVQHAYSFVFARPLRLILYIWLNTVLLVLATFAVGLVIWLALHFAEGSATAFSGDGGGRVLSAVPSLLDKPDANANREALSGADYAAAATSTFWAVIPIGLFFAYIVSFYWCSSTILYLIMRRIVDGQDLSEIWMPTLIGGTLAPVTPAPTGGAVADDGPADET